MTRTAAGRKAVLFIFVTILVDAIGFGVIMPVVPKLIMALTGEGVSRASLYGGWLWFTYAIMQFFCAPVLGNLSDKYGRRPVILYALFSLSIDYLIMGFAPNIRWLFLGRALAGIAGASFTPAYAYLADITTPDRRAQNFGLVGAAFGIGFIIGPAVGGLLGTFGHRVPFFFAAGLALSNLTLGAIVLPESLSKESRRPFNWKRANPVGTLMHFRRYPLVPGIAVAMFLWQVAHQVLPSTWAFYTMLRFGWSEAAVGVSLACVGLIVAISQGYLTRVLIPRMKERRAALIGMVFATVAYLGYAFATRGWMMYGWMITWLLAGLAYPSMNAIMSQQMPQDAQGELQGGVASLYSLASVVGPLLMTQIFGRFSAATAKFRFPGAAFACAALLTVVSAALLLRALRSAARTKRTGADQGVAAA
jgi:MFS transporter, DHA1 family, tetracycline resistance protein